MKTFILALLTGISFCINVQAQIPTQGNLYIPPPDTLLCGATDRDTTELEALPWFGNNQYLENFLDSIGYPPPSSNIVIGLDRVIYRIPIKFWVYRNSAGFGGPTLLQIRAYMRNLNNYFNNINRTLIGFYMKCEISYIDDDSHLEVDDSEAQSLIQDHKEKGCINIHVTNFIRGADGVHYRGRFFGIDGIFLNRSTYTVLPDNEFVIAHEVGHYLELDHTHQYNTKGKCRKEAIDRNRTWPFPMICQFGSGGLPSQKICEATGDCLSDTPADHLLTSNFSCIYYQTGNTDPWGDQYENPPAGSSPPSTRNMMSYNADRTCIIRFTRLQIAVMLHSIIRGKSKSNLPGWEAIRTIYDEYEMDNFPESPSAINTNEIQERNFHQQYNEAGNGDVTWTNCDVDWIRFTAACTALFDIETFYNAGTLSPDTRLTLFDVTGTNQLAQNDDKSATDKFSKISYNFVAGQTYLIRVENLNPQIIWYNNSYYNISVGGARITGVDKFCGSYTYTLDAPAGTTVTWSMSPDPNNICTISASGNSVTVTQKPIGPDPRIANSGSVTLTGTYNNGCLGNGSVSRQIFIGTEKPSYGLEAPDGYCPGANYEAIATAGSYGGTLTYDWYINGQLNSFHGYKLRSTFTSPTGTTIGVQVRKDGCGISEEYYQFWSCGGFNGEERFTVSPNPSSNNLYIEAMGKTTFERVRIIDKLGNLKREWNLGRKQKSKQLDISNLPTDIYTIQIFDGKTWLAKLISVIK